MKLVKNILNFASRLLFNPIKTHSKSFSLYYYDLVRTLFLILGFFGILSTGWFGIPLAPHYFTDTEINTSNAIFAILSSVGSVWGIMAYRAFTKSRDQVLMARDLCKRLDSNIGNYEYNSFDPETKIYVQGYVHLGPTDFWDRETTAPEWLDKGKYWYIYLRLKTSNKEIILKVVRDDDLPVFSGNRNVATTSRELLDIGFNTYRYTVCIPQWLVINTDMRRFANDLDRDYSNTGMLINTINKQLVISSDDIILHEKQRIVFPWHFSSVLIYLIKSLPIMLIYEEIYSKTTKYLPAQKKHIINETNMNLAYVTNDELIKSLLFLARLKNIRSKNIEKIYSMLQFLKNEYEKQGLGDSSHRYHDFHHSLEVAYVSLQMLPPELQGYNFSWEEYEYLLIAGILHDYDPHQFDYKSGVGWYHFEGPKVERTIKELTKIRIIDAYFSMDQVEFNNYFREYKYYLLPPNDYVTTHPEYVKLDKLLPSLIVEAMIWRTDYPFSQKLDSQQHYHDLFTKISNFTTLSKKYKLLSEILGLTDLAVTYMASDPISAWDRVTSLYNELMLSKSDAILGTYNFFSEFMELDLFKKLIQNPTFPDIFKQRWNLVYQFYYEGNPSTQINRMIISAQKSYSKINLLMGLKTGDFLYFMASEHREEYFIGIGTDQAVVLSIKNRFANLKQKNASSFWGEPIKLLVNLQANSVDNIFFILSASNIPANRIIENKYLFLLFQGASHVLKPKGTFQLISNIKDTKQVSEIIDLSGSLGFKIIQPDNDKVDLKSSNFSKEFFTESGISTHVFQLIIY